MTAFDPEAPLPGAPDPWVSSSMPAWRDAPPYAMTEMIAAEPALGERLARRLRDDPAVTQLVGWLREVASAGSYIAPDGTVTPLSLGDWTIETTDTWTSPTSGAEYPAGWRVSVPSMGLELEGRPMLADQELNLSTIYWEGAVAFSGTLDGAPLGARGYIELTGYAGSMEGRF